MEVVSRVHARNLVRWAKDRPEVLRILDRRLDGSIKFVLLGVCDRPGRSDSLCCAVEGCRRRMKPPSVLFMDRRVYWGCIVLITTTLMQGRATGYSAGRLMKQFGMSRKTLKRWMTHFREIFPTSAAWKKLRGRVSSEVRERHLPGDLLEAFGKTDQGEGGVAACLRFLAGGLDPC